MAEITNQNELKQRVLSYYEELTGIQNELTANTDLACRSGCSYCCSLHITLKPYELLLLIEEVEKLPPAEQEELRRTVERNCSKIENADDSELLTINFECPFLRDNSCFAYKVRPTSCRIAHSKSVTVCEEAYHHPNRDIPADHTPNFTEVSRAFEEEFENDLGEYHDVSDYNMNMALREALDNPHWIERFLNGDEVFSDEALSRV